ncbi:MAG: YkgJ family cysteine cluster protein [Myxococcales bacterium]|nr:YkgJ family cysteine cluster protein [Myxococcales bacterium]MCB9704605.1 YkgJ family cysteine cluster protein [Myxococcales bacterium]
MALRLAGDAAALLDARGAASAGAAARACGPGCAFCCHLPVTLSVPEGLRILAHIDSLDVDARERAVAAVFAVAAAVSGDSEELLFLVRRPCAFLGEDQRCTIYEVRPIACRGHASMSRQACADAHAAPEDPALADAIPIDLALRDEKNRTKTTLGLTLLQAGRDPLDYELHTLLRALLVDAQVGEAWLSGQGGEAPARVLAISREALDELRYLADALD